MDDAAELITQYIAYRDYIERESKRFQEHLAKPREEMEKLEGKLLEKLNALGGNGKQSIKTAAGTCYKSTITTPKVVDRDMYLEQVMDNYSTWGAGMLQLREPKKEAIEQFMTENDGKLPLGVEVSSFIRVNVRKPT